MKWKSADNAFPLVFVRVQPTNSVSCPLGWRVVSCLNLTVVAAQANYGRPEELCSGAHTEVKFPVKKMIAFLFVCVLDQRSILLKKELFNFCNWKIHSQNMFFLCQPRILLRVWDIVLHFLYLKSSRSHFSMVHWLCPLIPPIDFTTEENISYFQSTAGGWCASCEFRSWWLSPL